MKTRTPPMNSVFIWIAALSIWMGFSKRRKLCLAACAALVGSITHLAGGTFYNLDFEDAQIVPVASDPYNRVDFNPAFPYWIGYVGDSQQSRALYNGAFLSAAGIGLLDANFLGDYSFEGQYTAHLQNGTDFSGDGFYLAAISQTGLVPQSARSIQFYASSPVPKVSFSGQQIPLFELGNTASYHIYGGDISSFAGQSGELRFEGSVYLDNIQFSPTVIPEPGTIALTVVGGLLLGIRHLRKASRI